MNEKPKTLVFFEEWVDPVAETILAAEPDIDLRRLRYDDPRSTNDDVMARAHGYQVQARTELREPWFGDAALIARSPRLLAMSSTGAGYDYIDTEACTAAGVLVLHQSGSNSEAVAEHALGMMLVLSKRMAVADKALRRGGTVDRYALQGNDVQGKTLGIVGLGLIGRRLAGLCNGLLGMRVLAYDPYLDAAEISARGAEQITLDALLAQSDFVSVHCPRNAETLNLFGAAEFARMKPTAYFINTARGGIHDEAALAQALAENRIAGAGIDVFLREPPPADHPLLRFDNVIASPHTAGITAEALRQMSVMAAQQWIDVLAGKVPPRLVNPEVWPLYTRRFEELMGHPPDALP
ncbi:hydroxyacid dehydrogenase (plasmid) [Roseomonas sp. OT10]|uniref:hydroxyacid dehydrogenase n=1 Tax=Roseomonas cutis TaxID=2897332 RepID=UPI001E4C1380|nr:hydroxyacid dehydrogenase [Roseomonas sp. OT10]UFN51546.1 hydroxyacid dehydrogenase [Roseomonas sp. OT10]